MNCNLSQIRTSEPIFLYEEIIFSVHFYPFLGEKAGTGLEGESSYELPCSASQEAGSDGGGGQSVGLLTDIAGHHQLGNHHFHPGGAPPPVPTDHLSPKLTNHVAAAFPATGFWHTYPTPGC